MVDIVFNQSAFYSMQASQHILEHISSERTTLLLFRLGLDAGDISGDILGNSRRTALRQYLRRHFPSATELEKYISEIIAEAKESLSILLNKARQGEKVRFWYSDLPEEICGTFWLMSQILEMNKPCGQICEIKFPKYTVDFGGVINSWGELPPDKWSFFLSREQPLSPLTQHIYSSVWMRLQQENAERRAVLNGSLLSVPASLYSFLIANAIEKAGLEFREGDVIADAVNSSECSVCIGDITPYIDELIAAGKLEAIQPQNSESDLFQRVLRKREI